MFCLRAEMQVPIINSRQDSSLRAAPARPPPEGLYNALTGKRCPACCLIFPEYFGICASFLAFVILLFLVHSPDSSESERAPSPVRRFESPSHNSDHRLEMPPMTYIYIIHTYNSKLCYIEIMSLFL